MRYILVLSLITLATSVSGKIIPGETDLREVMDFNATYAQEEDYITNSAEKDDNEEEYNIIFESVQKILDKLASTDDGPFYKLEMIYSHDLADDNMYEIEADFVDRNGKTQECVFYTDPEFWLKNHIQVKIGCYEGDHLDLVIREVYYV